jgi:hypothetical protein
MTLNQDFGFSRSKNSILSVKARSFVIPRWSVKRNMTFDHEIGDWRVGYHSFPTRWSKRALERVTVTSPGAVLECVNSSVFRL